MHQRKGRAVDIRAVVRFLVRGTRRAAVTLAGFALVAIGMAGLLLPFLPGWVLIIGGFAVLSREYAWAQAGLSLARRFAARGGTRLRSLANLGDRSGEVVIDLTTRQETAYTAGTPLQRRASNLP